MTHLQKADIIRLAELSSLTFSDKETDALLIDLQNILQYVDQLNGITLTEQPAPVSNSNVFRADAARTEPCLNLITQAPEHQETYFVVPKVVDSSKDAQ